jgi:curved DNA-binding protein CbpA
VNPYLVLGVPRDADNACIRHAYLEAIKQATPESHPARFKALTAAYGKLKDESSRFHNELFSEDCPGDAPLDVFLQHVRLAARPAPLPFEAMKDYLRSFAKQ